MEVSDEVLVERARAGGKEAFGLLVDRHSRMVYNLAFRISGSHEQAEDIAQEAFLRAYRALAKFEGKSQFSTWLYRIVSNVALNKLERDPSERVATDRIDPASHHEGPAQTVVRRERQEQVRRAVLSLPSNYRLVITLHHLQGFSYDEVAETLELPLGTVKTYIFRAKQILKQSLAQLWAES